MDEKEKALAILGNPNLGNPGVGKTRALLDLAKALGLEVSPIYVTPPPPPPPAVTIDVDAHCSCGSSTLCSQGKWEVSINLSCGVGNLPSLSLDDAQQLVWDLQDIINKYEGHHEEADEDE